MPLTHEQRVANAHKAWATKRERYGARGRPNVKRASPGTRPPRNKTPDKHAANSGEGTTKAQRRHQDGTVMAERAAHNSAQKVARQRVRRQMEAFIRADKVYARLVAQRTQAQALVREAYHAEANVSTVNPLNTLTEEIAIGFRERKARRVVRNAEKLLRQIEQQIAQRESVLRQAFARQAS